MIYLSGSYHTIAEEYRAHFGYMLNVNNQISHESQAVRYPWMLDNGAFSQEWNELRWRKRLRALSRYTSTCIAAIVPDVVFDADATLDKWRKYHRLVAAMGYKTAFVTQNGLDIRDIPWDELDVLMIGGDHTHKMGSKPVREEARARGKWVHVARVNSVGKMLTYEDVDSVDGNHFVHNRGAVQSFVRVMERINKRSNARVHL